MVAECPHDDQAGADVLCHPAQDHVGHSWLQVNEHVGPEQAQAGRLSREAALSPQDQRVTGSLPRLLGPEIERMHQMQPLASRRGQAGGDGRGVTRGVREVRPANDDTALFHDGRPLQAACHGVRTPQ